MCTNLVCTGPQWPAYGRRRFGVHHIVVHRIDVLRCLGRGTPVAVQACADYLGMAEPKLRQGVIFIKTRRTQRSLGEEVREVQLLRGTNTIVCCSARYRAHLLRRIS